MAHPHPYDVELVRILRRTVEYWRHINHRTDLPEEDKAALKHHFLKYLALPRAEKLHCEHTRRGQLPLTEAP